MDRACKATSFGLWTLLNFGPQVMGQLHPNIGPYFNDVSFRHRLVKHSNDHMQPVPREVRIGFQSFQYGH